MSRLIDANLLKQYYKSLERKTGTVATTYDSLYEVIDRQPTVDVTDINVGKWIPCSERLPDKNTICLAWSDGEYEVAGFIGGFIVDFEIDPYVTAWMPLPDEYKGDKE